MRMIFSIFAAVLFAASINAQEITFGEGSTGDQTYGEGDFVVTVAGWNGSHSATSSRAFGTLDSYTKPVGMIASKGAVNGKDRKFFVESKFSGTLDLFICSSNSDGEEVTVTIGENAQESANLGASTDGKTGAVYKILSYEIKYGKTDITLSRGAYLYKIDFTSNGESAPVVEERDTVAAFVQSILKGDFVAVSSDDKVLLEYNTKYNANSTACVAMTFTTSIKSAKDTLTDEYCMITPAEGIFKAGDIVTFQPFTVMSTTDFEGTKYGNIRMLGGGQVEEVIKASKLYETAASAEDKSDVTDGHEQAGDIKVHTFTLTEDCDALFIGRTGNTRVNVLSFVVTRAKEEQPSAVESVESSVVKAVKTIENGRIVIIRDNIRYDVIGRRL